LEEISLNIAVREEQMEDKKVFIVNNEELGVADFGDTLDQAIENFKKAAKLYLEAYPEKKKELVKKEQPILVSRIFL
jgi:predicted RNase H-like HicB family nuclease